MKKAFIVVSMYLLLAAVPALAADYAIDPVHSEVGFSVKHLVISRVKGVFDDYAGSVTIDDKGALTAAEAVIQAKSVNTRIGKRDDDLRSPNFFDAAKYPTLSFKSKSVKLDGSGGYLMTGDLTIHGVTKEVVLKSTVTAPVKDPCGYMRLGFAGSTTIDRKDFGLTWSKVMETGGLMVGDDVIITIEGEAVLKK